MTTMIYVANTVKSPGKMDHSALIVIDPVQVVFVVTSPFAWLVVDVVHDAVAVTVPETPPLT